MCGIVGFISLRPGVSIDKEEILSMTNSIAHRGPNDHGCVLIENETRRTAAFKYADEPIPFPRGDVGLGNRRLSIIDLTTGGHQPMAGPGGQVWMTYNGEIYNYVELRQTLERIGYQFKSSSDSEVVLTSYLHWGIECFEKFNGMWAIALFDL